MFYKLGIVSILMMTSLAWGHEETNIPEGATFEHITYGNYPHSHRITFADFRTITYNFWRDINEDGHAVNDDGSLRLDTNGNPIEARHVAGPTNYKDICGGDRIPRPDFCETGVRPVAETGTPVVTPEPTPEPEPTPTDTHVTEQVLPTRFRPQTEPVPIVGRQETLPKSTVLLMVTEYMLLDNGRRLPHWIELYNPNSVPVDLAGYTFTYPTRRFANDPWKYHEHTLSTFEIPAKSAIILASHNIMKAVGKRVDGIKDSQIYQLRIHKHVLKNGWLLQDVGGKDVHRVGKAFSNEEHPNLRNPVVPVHAGRWIRQSHQRYPSGDAPTLAFYGKSDDKGSPGFYEPVRKAPASEHSLTIGVWAALKKR